jgi:hypothetical protein
MLKAVNGRSNVAQRCSTLDWRTLWDIKLRIETGSRVLAGSDVHFFPLTSERIGDLRYLKRNNVEHGPL